MDHTVNEFVVATDDHRLKKTTPRALSVFICARSVAKSLLQSSDLASKRSLIAGPRRVEFLLGGLPGGIGVDGVLLLLTKLSDSSERSREFLFGG